MSAGAERRAAGFDIGGTKILGRVLDPDDATRPLGRVRVDTPRGAPGITAALAGAVADLDAQLDRLDGTRVEAVGIGIAGLVDRRGRLPFAPNLPGVIDFDVPVAVAEAVGRPTVVDNDANCAAVGRAPAGRRRGGATTWCWSPWAPASAAA